MANVRGKEFEVESALPSVSATQNEFDPLSDLFSSTLRADDSSFRLAQYKCRLRDETSQEIRRRSILQLQKEKRNAIVNDRRKVETTEEESVGGWFEEKIFIEEDDDEMEWSSIKKVDWHQRSKHYKDFIMLSEWFEDIPSDFTEKWIMVPCPVGKRSLVVSKQMRTTSFSKKGIAVCNFKSLLPARTILDCIYCFKTKSFYVMDVIKWNGLSFRNCQTDFRFYWLDSKFQENPDYSSKSESNHYPLIKLPRCGCSINEISGMVNNYPIFPNNNPKLDGLLFYHSETHYTSGFTPLVTWLKPFMLADAFQIPIPHEYDEDKPEGYTNYKQLISDKDEKRKEYWANKKECRANKRLLRKSKMECEEISSDVQSNDTGVINSGDSIEIDNSNSAG